jgi:hypothetical protein
VDAPDEPAQCAVVASGLVMANGITANTDRSRIYVNDLPLLKMRVYERLQDGALRPSEAVTLPHAVDNIEYDDATGDVLMGSLPTLHANMAADEAADPLSAQTAPGGLLVASTRAADADPLRGGRPAAAGVKAPAGEEGWHFYDLVMHRGDKLRPVSAGARYVSDGRTRRAAVGSPWDRGLLVCDVQ